MLAAPLAALFFLVEPWTNTGGLRTPDFGLLPARSALVGFGTAFAFGWFMHRQTLLLEVWRQWWWLYLATAIALSYYCAGIISTATTDPSTLPSGAPARLIMAGAYPLAIWMWCLGLIGASIRFLSGESASLRYLADSSYWVYLAHLPLVVALQVLVSPWQLGWQVKYPLILVIAVPMLLVSYQLLVRNTALGGWLNGRRYGKTSGLIAHHASV